MRYSSKLIVLATLAVIILTTSCGATSVSGGSNDSKQSSSSSTSGNAASKGVGVAEPEFSTIKILNKFPHSTDGYTQGLLIEDGVMYESTGEYGHSSLRIVDLESGKVEKKIDLEGRYFGEGLAYLDGKLYQLTWMEKRCFVYDAKNLKRLATFDYEGQGWGLVSYGDKLLMSNGSSEIKVIDPKNFRIESTFEVRDNRGKVGNINELEIVNGKLYANLYTSTIVAVIDIETGIVERYIDCSPLYKAIGNRSSADVLNGIAYDSVANKLYMTGKLWDTMFEVGLPE